MLLSPGTRVVTTFPNPTALLCQRAHHGGKPILRWCVRPARGNPCPGPVAQVGRSWPKLAEVLRQAKSRDKWLSRESRDPVFRRKSLARPTLVSRQGSRQLSRDLSRDSRNG